MEVGLALVGEPALDTLPLIVHPIFLYIHRLHTALTGRVNNKISKLEKRVLEAPLSPTLLLTE